jgi:GNAT superfamily N-acetyltransferase
MEIKDYVEPYFNDVYDIVHITIEEIYPKYYPRKAVDYFHNLYAKENMIEKLSDEYSKIALDDDKVIGIGSVKENNIRMFYILPAYQNKGYGKLLYAELEKEIIRKKDNAITLTASLGAVFFYKSCGFTCRDYKILPVENNENLCYFEMVKEIGNILKLDNCAYEQRI